MRVINISTLKKNFESTLNCIEKYNDSITVTTKNGNAVIISEDDYTEMLEVIHSHLSKREAI